MPQAGAGARMSTGAVQGGLVVLAEGGQRLPGGGGAEIAGESPALGGRGAQCPSTPGTQLVINHLFVFKHHRVFLYQA